MAYYAQHKSDNCDNGDRYDREFKFPASVNVDSLAPEGERRALAADYLKSMDAPQGKYNIMRYTDKGEFHSCLFTVTLKNIC